MVDLWFFLIIIRVLWGGGGGELGGLGMLLCVEDEIGLFLGVIIGMGVSVKDEIILLVEWLWFLKGKMFL